MSRNQLYVILVCGILLLSIKKVEAQSGSNVASNGAIINGNSYDYSIGEMTLISTERNNHMIVTQGLLQPNNVPTTNDILPASASFTDFVSQVKVYPNPTESMLYIEMNEPQIQNLNFQLMDQSGKVISSNSGGGIFSNDKYALDLTSLAAGNYYIILKTNISSIKSYDEIYTIQKLK